MDQKVKQHRFLMYLWLLHTPKKLIQNHLLRPGSDQKGPDPTGSRSGSTTLAEISIVTLSYLSMSNYNK
jgi:hypothetical protein